MAQTNKSFWMFRNNTEYMGFFIASISSYHDDKDNISLLHSPASTEVRMTGLYTGIFGHLAWPWAAATVVAIVVLATGVNYLVSEMVVVPSTEGCCKTGGSEHHADDQGELHICDSSEVELFLNDCTEIKPAVDLLVATVSILGHDTCIESPTPDVLLSETSSRRIGILRHASRDVLLFCFCGSTKPQRSTGRGASLQLKPKANNKFLSASLQLDPMVLSLAFLW
ncbi:uncharacterized protein ARB_00622 [Trichophyton benhamiae CBS 112371]|uniref:Uncharacterized protein n=1 Tax=Arthroderma benhamiae (strain ATCC MYA-4681 / CBS 112371) TaxID=663331 RepID=D4AWQ6_ARTBC|nr:uncharacterized protein ARB_00622 [Trichophyton benhamiae CBS 112371]EFE32437.1 hypothetical protein ARB_00622 [Trichophyton benhamiae CBS 112371]